RAPRDCVDCRAQGRRGPALYIAEKRSPQSFQWTTKLQCEACGDCRVARVAVGLAAGLVVLQEDFADAAIRQITNRRGVRETTYLELERFGSAPVGQPQPLTIARIAIIPIHVRTPSDESFVGPGAMPLRRRGFKFQAALSSDSPATYRCSSSSANVQMRPLRVPLMWPARCSSRSLFTDMLSSRAASC